MVDSKEYKISNEEKDVLELACKDGQRGIIFFENFAISIPHISSIEKDNWKLKGDNERMLEKLNATRS